MKKVAEVATGLTLCTSGGKDRAGQAIQTTERCISYKWLAPSFPFEHFINQNVQQPLYVIFENEGHGNRLDPMKNQRFFCPIRVHTASVRAGWENCGHETRTTHISVNVRRCLSTETPRALCCTTYPFPDRNELKSCQATSTTLKRPASMLSKLTASALSSAVKGKEVAYLGSA